MIAEKSKAMMVKSFRKTRYTFENVPKATYGQPYGVYVHVPFCLSKCAFCPFYKEVFSEDLKTRYVSALRKEISLVDLSGTPSWVYFGGGTPNTLSIEDLGSILAEFRKRISLTEVGIELLPRIVSEEYLNGLREIGVTKVSFGVESLNDDVLGASGRIGPGEEGCARQIERAHKYGLWSNADLMVGLPEQRGESFLHDVTALSSLGVSQVTMYPFMTIGNTRAVPGMPDHQQFALIEKAGEILCGAGYQRKSVWVFAKGDNVYDSSRDELVTDYAGFGPAAFSTFGSWKVVNPELSLWLNGIESGQRVGLVAPKSQASDHWRIFARMLYDTRCEPRPNLPWYINGYVRFLRAFGFGTRSGACTAKGLLFAHDLTKTVVESLPYPLQNPQVIGNFDEYERAKKAAVALSI